MKERIRRRKTQDRGMMIPVYSVIIDLNESDDKGNERGGTSGVRYSDTKYSILHSQRRTTKIIIQAAIESATSNLWTKVMMVVHSTRRGGTIHHKE